MVVEASRVWTDVDRYDFRMGLRGRLGGWGGWPLGADCWRRVKGLKGEDDGEWLGALGRGGPVSDQVTWVTESESELRCGET